jgi:hypothetical protein
MDEKNICPRTISVRIRVQLLVKNHPLHPATSWDRRLPELPSLRSYTSSRQSALIVGMAAFYSVTNVLQQPSHSVIQVVARSSMCDI